MIHFCQWCDRTFLRPDHLQRHERVHLRTKLFKCYVCASRFGRRDSLLRHYSQVHDIDVAEPAPVLSDQSPSIVRDSPGGCRNARYCLQRASPNHRRLSSSASAATCSGYRDLKTNTEITHTERWKDGDISGVSSTDHGDYFATSVMDFDSFFRSTPLPPPDYSHISKLVLAFEESSNVLHSLVKLPGSVTVVDTWYTATDGTKLRAKVYKPATLLANGSPLVVIFHGGGFCVGDPEDESQTCCNIVQAFSAICVSVQYRLAPDFPFPYAVTDAWDALNWAAESFEALGADPSAGFIVGGISAGGNLTAVLTHLAREHGLSPPLTGQYLAVPHVCPADRIPEKYQHHFLSYEQNKNAPLLPQVAIDLFFASYKPDHDDPVNYSILLHPAGHSNLPPAYFQVCGMDPLRDEALIYESILREEDDIPTKLDVYPGLPHCFWQILPMLKSSMKFREDQIRGFGWLLKIEPQPLT